MQNTIITANTSEFNQFNTTEFNKIPPNTIPENEKEMWEKGTCPKRDLVNEPLAVGADLASAAEHGKYPVGLARSGR
jgi:hypothetical protein